jgi:hypothetical protein
MLIVVMDSRRNEQAVLAVLDLGIATVYSHRRFTNTTLSNLGECLSPRLWLFSDAHVSLEHVGSDLGLIP